VASVPVIVPLGTHWQGSDLHVTGMTTTEGVYLDNNGGLALVCVKGDGTAQWDTCATCPIILA
jgi:hypothetical protein